MLGPVITTEAHFADAGARIQSNNTAELSSIVETFFQGPLAWLSVVHNLASFANSKHAARSRLSPSVTAISVEATVCHAAHPQPCPESGI